MIHQRHRRISLLYLAVDLAATIAAFFAAWYLRFVAQVVPVELGVPDISLYLWLLPAVLLVWPVIFYFHGLYRSRRVLNRVDEVATLTVAVLLGSVVMLSFTALYRPELADGSRYNFSRWFLVLFMLSNLFLVAASRFSVRSVLRQLRLRGHNLQRILIIGAGQLGREITQKILAHREMGFEVVGYLDDDPGLSGRAFGGIPVLGVLDDVNAVVQRETVDQVMIALPLESYKKTQRLLQQVGTECVQVRLVPDIFQYATLRASLEDLDGTPVINLSQAPLQGWQSLAKRVMDMAIAFVAMIVLLPLLPLVALLIWREDKGPVFYRQERMGLDGRAFMIYKFRSMRVNAESSTGPIWAQEDDPRRTRFGTFLRQTSLDELPQLWNVIRGDMSIVGPRPERPSFVHEFKSQLPNYMQRHRVKAGITGWAQVHGWRGNTSIRKRLQYDLYYIQNWTLGLDFKILWLTFRQGMRTNAY